MTAPISARDPRPDPATSAESSAFVATAPVLGTATKAGATPRQARALREAMQAMLLDADHALMADILEEGGFSPDAASDLAATMLSITEPVAA